jgi:anti-sigma factor (TIGR02949 family)
MSDSPSSACAEVRARLDDYLDQEQAPEQTGRILAHLDACPECDARYEAAYQELAVLRAAAGHTRAPADLRDRLLQAIDRLLGQGDG